MFIFDTSPTAQYDFQALRKYGFAFIAITLLMAVSRGMVSMFLPIAAIIALTQKKAVMLLFVMLLATFITSGNTAIFGGLTAINVLSVRGTLVILAFLVSNKAFNVRATRLNTPLWGVMAYLLWECAVSLQGFQPIVSYLKLILFIFIFLGMFGVANVVNASTRVNAKILRSMILCLLSMFLIGSVALIPFPSLSLMTNKADLAAMLAGETVSLFCGICGHSQALGPVVAISGVFVLTDLIISIKKWDKFYLILLACALICIYKTSSRTAMGTFLGGAAFATWAALRARGLGAKWKQNVMSAITLVIIGFSVLTMASPGMRGKITQFVMKWSDTSQVSQAEVTFEKIVSSRQGLIDEALYNFKRKPMLGNGFQVSSEMQGMKGMSFKDYLTAPVEKGVWIYAVLEEGGAIGMILFAGWLVFALYTLVSRHAYITASTLFAFALANMGEFCFFAMSYTGGLFWALVFTASCLDVQRMKSTNMEIFWVPIEQVIAEEGMDEWVRRQG